jgi:ankyrin repeat protein
MSVHELFQAQDPEKLDQFVQALAAANQKTNPGCTAMHVCAELGHCALLAKYLAEGMAVNAIDADGDTPLHMAAQAGRTSAVALLIQHGAALEAKNFAGGTAPATTDIVV